MRISSLFLGLAAVAATTVPAAAHVGEAEHPVVRSEPIAGFYNRFWYNYLTDVLEADKELKSDLRRATPTRIMSRKCGTAITALAGSPSAIR